MKNTNLFLFLLLLSAATATGQTSGAFERAADKYLADNNYYAAMITYSRMINIDSADAKGWAGYAGAARLQGAFEESEAAYQRIFDGKTKLKDARAPYWLAAVKQDQGKWAEATALYNQFLASPGGADSSSLMLAKEAINTCDYASKHHGNLDLDTEVKPLPEPINSPEGEYGPALVGDLLYFSSNREEWENDKHFPKRSLYKGFRGNLSDNGSTLAKTDFNENDRHTANMSFSADGHWMYYSIGRYRTDAQIESHLWRREKLVDGTWGSPTELPEHINAPAGYTTTEPHITIDAMGNDVLYFVSDRPGGAGKLDIYRCTIAKDGTYGNVENLAGINTADDDITPYWHRKNSTLYFSTKGRASLGGFDIYKSEEKKGAWTDPFHLPPPTNGIYNDAYYSILPDESGALFCSNRREAIPMVKEGENGKPADGDFPRYRGDDSFHGARTVCCYDIFRAEFLGIDLVAITFHKVTKDSLRGTTIRLVELIDGKKPGDEIKLDVAGAFAHFPIEREKYYVLIAEKPDFTKDTVYFSTVKLDRKVRTIKQELFLRPALVDLTAYCFDKKTGKELTGTTMRFEEIVGGNRSETSTNDKGNSYFYDLGYQRKYRLIASKVGYISDTVEVSTQGFDRFTIYHLMEKLYLTPSLESFLPLAVFFDNDEPNKRVTRPTTTTTYGQSYKPYYEVRKADFIQIWNKANPSMNSAQYLGQMTMEQFFEERVRGGWERLELLSKALAERLDGGEYIQLTIKGYASPRAKSDYNKFLTGRRIWSLKNHFAVWNGGALAGYIEDKQLTFAEQPNGEDTAPTDIADNIKDETNSIYSIRASYERRVEIVEVTISQGPAQQSK